jgi:predicted alpha/beta-fold hydrolase
MILKSTFKAAWWLTNAHVQTIYPSLMRSRRVCVDKQERVELPDGDFIDLAYSTAGLSPDAPLVILLHGLGGNVDSSYVSGLLPAFNQQGWRAVLMHFRGASKEPNRLPRVYHAGDTDDLDYILRIIHQREPHTKKAAVGISLGGNVLLKWLGEQKKQTLIQAAVAVSVPFQLHVLSDKLNQGVARIYQNYLLKRYKQVLVRKYEHHADKMPCSLDDLNQKRCFWTFDDVLTAPLHGFPHVHAYYRTASSRAYLIHIETPTLIIHAKDDPFMTQQVIPTEAELSMQVTLELSQKGGHVGFITGNIPGKPVYWLDNRIPNFLCPYLSETLRGAKHVSRDD